MIDGITLQKWISNANIIAEEGLFKFRGAHSLELCSKNSDEPFEPIQGTYFFGGNYPEFTLTTSIPMNGEKIHKFVVGVQSGERSEVYPLSF